MWLIFHPFQKRRGNRTYNQGIYGDPWETIGNLQTQRNRLHSLILTWSQATNSTVCHPLISNSPLHPQIHTEPLGVLLPLAHPQCVASHVSMNWLPSTSPRFDTHLINSPGYTLRFPRFPIVTHSFPFWCRLCPSISVVGGTSVIRFPVFHRFPTFWETVENQSVLELIIPTERTETNVNQSPKRNYIRTGKRLWHQFRLTIPILRKTDKSKVFHMSKLENDHKKCEEYMKKTRLSMSWNEWISIRFTTGQYDCDSSGSVPVQMNWSISLFLWWYILQNHFTV